MSEEDIPSTPTCKEHFIASKNSIKVLICMVLGIKDENGDVIKDFDPPRFPVTSKKEWVPQNNNLFDEIIRRKLIMQDNTKLLKKLKREKLIEWLVANPISNEQDICFLRTRMTVFISEAKAVSNMNDVSRYWSGDIPNLRLIHCLIDFEDVRTAFLNSFNTKTRLEVDGRNTLNSMKKCPWKMISDKWNDESYNPCTTQIFNLHDDFCEIIDLSFSHVSKMEECTPSKAKDKFYKMKNDLIVVKNNWELSGNGDGCVARDSTEFDGIINGNDKRKFLNGVSSVCLYLWEKAEEFDLLQSVCQQLSSCIAIDSSSIRAIETDDVKEESNKKQKRSGGIKEEEKK